MKITLKSTNILLLLIITWSVSLMMASCKSVGFKGSSEIGPRNPGSNDGVPGGGPGSNGWPTNPASNLDMPNSTTPTAPLQIAFDAHEADDNSKWAGTYVYSVQLGSSAPVQILSYNAGATGTASVAGICQCGVRNEFNLFISAGNLNQNLATWHQESMAAHAKPTNAPDLLKFINKYPQYPQAAYTVYFAGFDHIFLGTNWCANSPFACDSRNWDNRDDNGIIFSCKISDCPNGGAGTELHFIGEDN